MFLGEDTPLINIMHSWCIHCAFRFVAVRCYRHYRFLHFYAVAMHCIAVSMSLGLLRVAFALFCVCALPVAAIAQARVGYVATSIIRERFPEAQQANQRIAGLTNDWKKELDDRQNELDRMDEEMRKKRLLWSDEERKQKEEIIAKKRSEREEFAKKKLAPGGEFDAKVTEILRPIEAKIYAAINEVAVNEGYDVIWDKSTNPLVYVNPKYDMTVRVLERLGTQAQDLKDQQKTAIESDTRNKESDQKRKSSRKPPVTKKEEPKKEEPKKDARTTEEAPRQ